MNFFVYPRSSKNGDAPDEICEVLASSDAEAIHVARDTILKTTPPLFTHSEDHIVLYDPDGKKIWFCTPDDV
jgi:hypothetical protein